MKWALWSTSRIVYNHRPLSNSKRHSDYCTSESRMDFCDFHGQAQPITKAFYSILTDLQSAQHRYYNVLSSQSIWSANCSYCTNHTLIVCILTSQSCEICLILPCMSMDHICIKLSIEWSCIIHVLLSLLLLLCIWPFCLAGLLSLERCGSAELCEEFILTSRLQRFTLAPGISGSRDYAPSMVT